MQAQDKLRLKFIGTSGKPIITFIPKEMADKIPLLGDMFDAIGFQTDFNMTKAGQLSQESFILYAKVKKHSLTPFYSDRQGRHELKELLCSNTKLLTGFYEI